MKMNRKLLTIGILVLGTGFALPAFGNEGKRTANVPNVHYEMVPHVVLPESIQYTPSTKNMNHLASRSLTTSPGYGIGSPFVATYTAFPSYQLPYGTPMKAVNQSVYPVSPKLAPQRLPEPKTDDMTESADDWALVEPKTLKITEGSTPIQLASNTEEIVTATAPLNMPAEITQTGIFCSTPKPPAAWSFSSPLFKAASVPMGNGGVINQMGPRGGGVNVGFTPMGGAPMPGMMGNPMMGAGGPQFYTLPNGFGLMALPPTHANCGLLRCRQIGPQWMLMPSGPMGAPMNGPAPQMAPPLDPAAFMMPQMPQMLAMQQPQPITAMTPYGMVVVGYRPAPMPSAMNPIMPVAMNPMMNAAMNPMMGMAMNPYQAQVLQLQQQIQLLQQQNAQLIQGQQPTAEGEGKELGDLQVPLSINPQVAMQQQMMQQMSMLGAYAPYAQMYAANANGAADPTAPMDPMTNPMMMGMNPMMEQQMMGMNPMMHNPMMQNPMMYGGNPYMMVGMGGGMHGGMGGPGFNQGGLSMSDMLMLMILMKDNQPRRQGLFARIAARRAERRQGGQNDMFQMMMQGWCSPYMPDAAMRMPSRNAYPYGYFGAQVGPQESANYGGFHNLYMGNTTYPGLY